MNYTFSFFLAASLALGAAACANPSESGQSATLEKQEDSHRHGGHQHKHGHQHSHGEANAYMNQSDFEELAQRFESAERDEYQQPDKVLAYLGDVAGLSIMDIGAGTGYFSFRLANAGAKVIAADVDDRFQEYIRQKRDSLGIGEDRLALRKLPYDSPELSPGEVDRVITVNTYHHFEDRPAYFAKVLAGLKPGGALYIIDFFKEETPVGPPLEMKISAEKVVAELKAAGFAKVEVESSLLPYQYIVKAATE